MINRCALLLVAVTACLALVCGSHRGPGGSATAPAGASSTDPIDRAWHEALARPAETLAGYQVPYNRRNKRPSRTTFEKFPHNPVVTLGPYHSYDAGHAEYPSVVEIADSLWMFYAAFGSGGYWSIAAATSPDGLHWTKRDVVLEPDSIDGSWDCSTIAFPQVLYDAAAPSAERFRLYYAGKSDAYYSGIGLAFSADGLSWHRHGLILATGGEGDWDGKQVVDPTVLRVGDGYRMYYCGSRSADGLFRVGLALSSDGKEWVKYPDNPVYALAEDQGRGLYTVDVAPAGSGFILFESTPDPEGFYDIYGVTSTDGLVFDSRRRRLVLSAAHDGTWDHVMVYGMDVLVRGPRVFLWFNGMYRKMVTRGGQIGLARADLSRLLSYLEHESGS